MREQAVPRIRGDSLYILWDGVAPHIRYLCTVYRDKCSRGIVRGKSDKVVERLGPGIRERFCCTLQHFVVDNLRRHKCGERGKEDNYAAQHGGAGKRAKRTNREPELRRDSSHIYGGCVMLPECRDGDKDISGRNRKYRSEKKTDLRSTPRSRDRQNTQNTRAE